MRFGKKGEETGSAVLWIILGVVAVIIIGLFIYNSFGKVSTAIDGQAPETQAVIAWCVTDVAGALGSPTTESSFTKYCTSFSNVKIDVGSVESYVSCAFLKEQGVASFSIDVFPDSVRTACNESKMKMAAYNKCQEFNETNKGSDLKWVEYINGVRCTEKFNYTEFDCCAIGP
jgi:hypothetical protein